MKKTQKIIIINQHTSNFGDDAAGICLIHQLLDHFPSSKIEIIYKKKAPGGDLIPISDERVTHRADLFLNEKDLLAAIAYTLLPRKLSKKVLAGTRVLTHALTIREADVVFVSPCGANIGRYKDKLFLFRVFLATKESKKVFFSLNSIGRSGALWYDFIAKIVLKKTFNFVRERKSYEDLRRWGVPVTLGVDTAFSMPLDLIKDIRISNTQDAYIAFIPTFSLKNWHPDFRDNNLISEFETIYSSLAFAAIRNNLKIIIIPHLHGMEDEADDLHGAAKEIRARGAEAIVAENIDSPLSYTAALSRAKFVVTMRYHGMVLAARTATPFVGISYENKMLEVASYCDLPDQVIGLKKISGENLGELIEKTRRGTEIINEKLLRSRARLERLSCLPADWLASFGSQSKTVKP